MVIKSLEERNRAIDEIQALFEIGTNRATPADAARLNLLVQALMLFELFDAPRRGRQSRRLAEWDGPIGAISTIAPPDGMKPFETGIIHDDYNDGNIMIVAAYDTEQQAYDGHKAWWDLLRIDKLPDIIQGVINDRLGTILGPAEFSYVRKGKARTH